MSIVSMNGHRVVTVGDDQRAKQRTVVCADCATRVELDASHRFELYEHGRMRMVNFCPTCCPRCGPTLRDE